MTDEQIEIALACCKANSKCEECPYYDSDIRCGVALPIDAHAYINRLKSERQLAETQLKELLSVLYQRTVKENGCFVVFRKDIVELAKDYGIKESNLNGKQ